MECGKATTAAAGNVAAVAALPSTPMTTVFLETTLDTRLAMLISPDDTIAILKCKIAAEHAICFSCIGEVNVQAIKVKKRASFYHLSDDMPVSNAFEGIKGTWFLYVDAEANNSVSQQLGAANISKEENGKNFPLVDPSLPNMGKNKAASLLNSHQECLLSGETDTKISEKMVSQQNDIHSISDPPSVEMQTQTSKNNDAIELQLESCLVVDHGKMDSAAEVQDKSQVNAKGTVAAVYQNKCKKRAICQDVSTIENQSKHFVAKKKKDNKDKDGNATFESSAVGSTTCHYAVETSNTDPHEGCLDFSQIKLNVQNNCESSLPSSPKNHTKKTRKKKQLYKSLDDVVSPLTAEISLASAENNDLIDKSKTTISVEAGATQRIPDESVQNTNDLKIGADKVVIRSDDACGRRDVHVTEVVTVAEVALQDNLDETGLCNLSIDDAGRKQGRMRKNMRKNVKANHLSEHDQNLGDCLHKENHKNGYVGGRSVSVSDGASLHDVVYGGSARHNDGQSCCRKENVTKNKLAEEEPAQLPETCHVDYDKQSKSLELHDKATDLQATTETDEVSPQIVSDGNISNLPQNHGIGEISKRLPIDCRNIQNEESKKANIPGESLSLKKTLLVDSAVCIGPNDRKPCRGRKKSAKSELLNSVGREFESLVTENIGVDDTGDKATETLTDNAQGNLMQNSKYESDKIDFIDFFAPKADSKETVSGKEFVSENARSRRLQSDKTKKKRKPDEQEEDSHPKEMRLGEEPANDTVDYGLSNNMLHHGQTQGFSFLETDKRKVNNDKTKRRKRKSDVHANISCQEHITGREKPSGSNRVNPDVNTHLADEENRSHKVKHQEIASGTTKSKAQDGTIKTCDRGSSEKSHKSCSKNMPEGTSAVHQSISESIDNQSKVMHNAETKALNPENNQVHQSANHIVSPTRGFIDNRVASDDSTEEEHQSNTIVTELQLERFRTEG